LSVPDCGDAVDDVEHADHQEQNRDEHGPAYTLHMRFLSSRPPP
jgi:hypothetical protein